MEQLEALALARTEIEPRIAAIGPDDWDRSTPCEGWIVRDLLRHLTVGSRMTVMVLEGASREEAIAFAESAVVPDDVVGEFAAGADAQAAAYAAPGAMERVVNHPAGDFPGGMLLGFRIGDWTVHAWDLSSALGTDQTLDPELVAYVWGNIEPAAPLLAASGQFGEGASGTLGADAPTQDRLLDAVGRRP